MSAFARVSVQWSSEEASEKQRALFLLSNGNHYVDLRIPSDPDADDDVENVIMTGKAKPIPNTNKVKYQQEINSVSPWIPGSLAASFNSVPNNDFVYEKIGEMQNPDTHKIQPYREIWRDIDPLKSDAYDFIGKDPQNNNHGAKIPCFVLKVVKRDNVEGTVIRVGNLIQGALFNTRSGETKAARYSLIEGEWRRCCSINSYRYMEDEPKIFKHVRLPTGVEAGVNIINRDGFEWEMIETNL